MSFIAEDGMNPCSEAFEMLTSLAKITHTILSHCGLNPHHSAVLVNIRMGSTGLTQKELAEKLFVRPSSITSMLDTLEKEGLVFRQSDEKDRRVKHIYLTRTGKALSDRFFKETAKLHTQFFAGFSPDESETFQACIHKIKSNMLSTLNETQKRVSCTHNKEDK